MSALIFRKIVLTIPVLILISIAAFSLMLIIPGDPVRAILGDFADPESVARMRNSLGLNQPAPERYWNWVTGLFRGDFGQSIIYNRSVLGLVKLRIAPTVWLAGGAILLSSAIGVPLGVISAARRGGIVDRLVAYITTGGLAIPEFLSGALLVYLFAVKLGWLPATGYVNPMSDPVDGLRHLVLPWACLATVSTAAITRMVHSGMLEVLNQDYIRTARAKGLSTRIVLQRHALPNALLSVLTLFGLIARQMIGGAVVIEILFAIPGIGSLLVSSVINHDYPVVQVLVLYLGIGVVFINVIVDILYNVLDPRVRAS